MDTSKSATQSEVQTLHFLDYWRIIRIRKTVILAVWLLVVLTTVGVTLALKPVFSSQAVIAVEKNQKDVTLLNGPQYQSSFDPYFMQTEFKKIQSTSVLYPVIDKLDLVRKWKKRYDLNFGDLGPDAQKQIIYHRLLNNLDVRQSRNTSLIEINVEDEEPAEAANIANAITASYKKWREQLANESASAGITTLQSNWVVQSTTVSNLQTRLDSLRNTLKIPDSGINQPSYQASIERQYVSSLQNQLAGALSDYTFYKTKYQQLTNLAPPELRKAMLTSVPSETILPQLLTDYDQAKQRLTSITNDYGPSAPEWKKAVALVSTINQQISNRLDGILEGLREQVFSLGKRIQAVSNDVVKARVSAAEEAERQQPYWTLKRKLESQQRLAEVIFMRMLQEQVDASVPSSSMVQVMTPAQVPLRPVRPNFIVNISLGVLVGLVMGIGLAFFIEYLDTSVKTIDDVERALQASVVGVIPQHVGLLINQEPDNPHAEAYRVLRTNILFSRKKPEWNSLTVVSGGAGEGKSTTVFNLSIVFAQNNQRVLLVDSDLRRPSLHKLLGLSNSIGLTNYLLKQNGLEEVIQTTKVPTLDFLPSGKLPSSSLGLLNSARMQEFIKDVKGRYDFVFFDSPPIMGVSDASILASEVDMSLLVVQYRKYPQAINVRAKQMVEKVGGNLAGIVLNNINISQDSYYYYYSGYYYDYYDRYDRYGSHDEEEEEKPADDGKNGEGAAPSPRSGGDLKSKY